MKSLLTAIAALLARTMAAGPACSVILLVASSDKEAGLRGSSYSVANPLPPTDTRCHQRQTAAKSGQKRPKAA